MIAIRKSKDRGTFDHGWLKTAHSFSFADYYDPTHMGFGSLRVINEDVVAPSMGFGKHPHRDMEIITYVISGVLSHEDSMGHVAPIPAGEIQYMSAGKGVYHSEFNNSETEPVHLLQIWITPNAAGLAPRYEQRPIDSNRKKNGLALLVSGDATDEAIQIRQDARIFASTIELGKEISYNFSPTRGIWIQLIHGEIEVNENTLVAGDAIALTEESALKISGKAKESEFLLFDLA